MSIGYYHGLCSRYRGRAVVIRTRDGRVHRGIIHRVTPNRVFLQPLGRGGRSFGGFGYGFYGGGWGLGWGIALGAIIGVSLASLLWW